jgi:hypothetical protein
MATFLGLVIIYTAVGTTYWISKIMDNYEKMDS